eukprot:GHVT01061829.1.p1 GENE.GHVT01061829.1~~GHVT01061829.1.p1  ORF type:complete len:234 (-),score=48.63 GHVT01061829.1:516-1217(-)
MAGGGAGVDRCEGVGGSLAAVTGGMSSGEPSKSGAAAVECPSEEDWEYDGEEDGGRMDLGAGGSGSHGISASVGEGGRRESSLQGTRAGTALRRRRACHPAAPPAEAKPRGPKDGGERQKKQTAPGGRKFNKKRDQAAPQPQEDLQFAHGNDAPPMLSICLAFVLTIVGTVFACHGYRQLHTAEHRLYSSLPQLILAALCLIPGVFHLAILALVVWGVPGYSYDMIASYGEKS